ncbi:exopolysaccharide biosynthesis polyprenyl glycosylphosphotransferase [Subsaximicrobium wynnwilliamsii]|uniref:Exopolysaccharide biosynthesis polyprenyl glycosylphosphotransferase n=1 Tax=Subsaximicrobium wynnwilliamsii TaxID=291179 RepID=A0A5C6ZIV8_9FLAO|nr:exopolysaccharide biosynthesis polyprenyl glycosylphosphotransferase [Subsaximicrobium wynnwilliamsii]TXD83946.1 exopolysaccharide biosynthesis polyprenyl glycosylphosphotransferase [Subsaximicrobium wynnwilliamsii]TXD89686.1 exopolysaccharide biosynthesis polyprenyl glycosylphosphotransferase [Subsaximicrobium wynnwilliamsii]TXE01671.1 exopolysaccharide biosynthesis polyprenyl glycosylphosphotransferase [Subsaximicrobium wynnwilliamsii]
MSLFKQGRYSGYLRPISYLIDLSILNGFAILYFFKTIDPVVFIAFASISWIILSIYSSFYEVYRFTREIKILSLTFRQMILFALIIFAFSGFYQELNIYPVTVLKYILLVFVLISFFKFAVYYLLQKYRVSFGGNYRRTVIFGVNKKTMALEHFFNKNPEYGYVHSKTFNFKEKKLVNLQECFRFIKENDVDEIYCSISELTNLQISEIVSFADNNLKILKFLPDNKEIYSKKLKYEYYDYIPILSLRNIALEDSFNMVIKRSFDIFFASMVIVFILSWLTPIIAIFIKLESKGPVFFKQSRNGFNFREFDCYKFRSMMPNKDAHLYQATRGDQRITKIGGFIRKTSIDELPQFYNVLFGDMSVVGPRPHMVSHTNIYAKRIDKFMVRHFVKPGITGLAQISGFRGEIETDKDIIGRVKYDIFYVENWSLFLDLKIITRTFLSAVKGDDKAY